MTNCHKVLALQYCKENLDDDVTLLRARVDMP